MAGGLEWQASQGALLPGFVPDGFTPLPPDVHGERGYRLGLPGPELPLLLLPGIEGDARVFARNLPLAARRTVLALDLPTGCASLEAMGARVLRRLDSLWEHIRPAPGARPRVAVVGLSLGGLVGRAMVSLAPETVAALVTLGTLPSPSLIPGGVRRGRLSAGALPAPIFDMLYGARIRHNLSNEGVDPMITSEIVAELPDKAEIVRRLDAVLSWGLDDSVPVPALWLLGQVDAEAPWTPADVVRALPGVAVEIVPGGHRAPLTHPVAFHDAVLRFVERRS